MTRIVVDDSLLNRLQNLAGELVFCDEAGRTLGYFLPAGGSDADLYGWARSEFTDDELERARREPGGISTDDLLRTLSGG